jgi:hypothetical protein
MIFEHIETLKKQYTDKYVVVDDSRPELQRFRGLTGSVKTVNMSGRALVEFDGYNNIGWYDIDPSFLKVVDAPAPKPVETKRDKAAAPKAESPKAPPAAAKPVGEKKPAAEPAAGKSVAEILAAARKPASAATSAPAAEAQPAKPAPGGKGMSMEDILAAARGTKPAGAAPAAKAEATPAAPVKSAPAPVAEKPAAAAPAKVAPGGKGMSMEQILAMARGKKTEAGPAPAAQAAAATPAPVQESAPAAEEPVAEEAAPEPVAEPAVVSGGKKSLKDQITSVADQIAYCRKVDSK